jgi:hypothetical protein
MDRVAPQMVMIIEVLAAQHQTIDPLTKELLNAMKVPTRRNSPSRRAKA